MEKYYCIVFVLMFLSNVVLNQRYDNLIFESVSTPMRRYTESCPKNKVWPVVLLLNHIAENYFNNCFTILLYDDYYYFTEKYHEIINELLLTYPKSLAHGKIITVDTKHYVKGEILEPAAMQCRAYILLTKDIETGLDVIEPQIESKVVLVPQASKWQVDSFLTGAFTHKIVNLLLITDPSLQVEEYVETKNTTQVDINMYSQNLYTDPIGATTAQLLTAWRCNKITRPHISLFPRKMKNGFNGYSFRLAGAQQPPFVFRKQNQQVSRASEEQITTWDGNEIRLLHLIAEILNFTLTVKESTDSKEDSAKRVLKDIKEDKADIAAAGIPLTLARVKAFKFSSPHSQDCANFVSLTSTALPKYRAILGPFRLGVWLGVIAIYIFAIIPITFSAKHTLKHLFRDPKEIENMFWYVFGTFTNCFTFVGKGSWTSGNMNSTRIFVGIYWMFTIILTAAYTGCIIAFITLPAYPSVVDTARDLLANNYKVGILNGSDWKMAFENSSDPITTALLKHADFVPSIKIGLKNITKSIYRRPYAFLGSKEELKYIIKTNFTPSSRHKKSKFHLSRECFIPLMLSIAFPKNAAYAEEMNMMMLRVIDTGFLVKLSKDVEWDQYRASTGRLLQVSASSLKLGAPEDRQLTLDDTQGMFMLLGIGFLLAILVLFTECYISVHKRLKKWCKYSTGMSNESPNTSQAPSIMITSYNGLMSYFGSRVSTIGSIFNTNKVHPVTAIHIKSVSMLNLPNSVQDEVRRNSY